MSTERIIVAGDWHASTPWATTVIEAAAELGIDKILHVGDFGIGMDDPFGTQYLGKPTYEGKVSAAAAGAGVDVFVVPGNHENWRLIDDLKADPDLKDVPAPDGFLPLTDRVHITHKTHRWTWGGVRFAALAGAFSIDWRARTKGYDWWPQEVPELADVETLGAEPADVLVSHDVAQGVPVTSRFRIDPIDEIRSNDVRTLVLRAIRNVRPKVAFAGHWHQRLTDGVRLSGGEYTRVEVLDREHTAGNAVVLELPTLRTVPLNVALLATNRRA